MNWILSLGAVAAGAAVLVSVYPDIRRYLRIRRM